MGPHRSAPLATLATLATLGSKLTFAGLVVGALALPGCSAEVEGAPPDDQNADELRGNHAVGTDLRTTADLNHRAAPNLEAARAVRKPGQRAADAPRVVKFEW